MFDPRHEPEDLAEIYSQNSPFPHIVIDDFLEPVWAAKIANSLEASDIRTWNYDDGVKEHQVNKRWLSDVSLMDPVVGDTLLYFNSDPALSFFSTLTGIDALQGDPRFVGGGVHVTERNGKLDVHADFNIHPDLGLHRRVNALLYLNRDWRREWNGQLELYAKNGECEVEVDPLFNRLVVFTITDDALHGVPRLLQCPEDRKRFSLALYYYTNDRPETEKAPFHWANWMAR